MMFEISHVHICNANCASNCLSLLGDVLYIYVNIFICPTFTHLYPNDIYRSNVEIFVHGPLPILGL